MNNKSALSRFTRMLVRSRLSRHVSVYYEGNTVLKSRLSRRVNNKGSLVFNTSGNKKVTKFNEILNQVLDSKELTIDELKKDKYVSVLVEDNDTYYCYVSDEDKLVKDKLLEEMRNLYFNNSIDIFERVVFIDDGVYDFRRLTPEYDKIRDILTSSRLKISALQTDMMSYTKVKCDEDTAKVLITRYCKEA